MAPSEQAMLADSFPPSTRAQAFAAYGVAVIVAPALGPTIGGYITDNASWHWIFFINVPIGALSLAVVAAIVDEPPALVRERDGDGHLADRFRVREPVRAESDLVERKCGSGRGDEGCKSRKRGDRHRADPLSRPPEAVPHSACCRPRTRPAITSRSCSAFR